MHKVLEITSQRCNITIVNELGLAYNTGVFFLSLERFYLLQSLCINYSRWHLNFICIAKFLQTYDLWYIVILIIILVIKDVIFIKVCENVIRISIKLKNLSHFLKLINKLFSVLLQRLSRWHSQTKVAESIGYFHDDPSEKFPNWRM